MSEKNDLIKEIADLEKSIKDDIHYLKNEFDKLSPDCKLRHLEKYRYHPNRAIFREAVDNRLCDSEEYILKLKKQLEEM